MSRREYLDWLRGVAVLVMIEAHTYDAWTRVDERADTAYRWAIVLGGFAAPGFLFLAGITLALAAGGRLRRGLPAPVVTAAAARWGWKVFGFAFLFRLQSWLISGGAFPRALFKVDILNVMGLGMVAAAGLWGLGRTRAQRIALLAGATAAVSLAAPLVRSAGWVAALPPPVGWYLAPVAGWSTFSLAPWVGFLFAGAALGLLLDAVSGPDDERRLMGRLAVAGPALAVASFAGSMLPSMYASSSFWTTSPSFFFLRLGLLLGALPVAYRWTARHTGWSPVRELGVASFFVYWVHVELVYGVLTLPIHKALGFEAATAAYAVFVALTFGLVRLKQRLAGSWAVFRQEPAQPQAQAPSLGRLETS